MISSSLTPLNKLMSRTRTTKIYNNPLGESNRSTSNLYNIKAFRDEPAVLQVNRKYIQNTCIINLGKRKQLEEIILDQDSDSDKAKSPPRKKQKTNGPPMPTIYSTQSLIDSNPNKSDFIETDDLFNRLVSLDNNDDSDDDFYPDDYVKIKTIQNKKKKSKFIDSVY